jgi:ATPase subunit of ABC transporter with duplicated ATPase domains
VVQAAPPDIAVGYFSQVHDGRTDERVLDYLARHTGIARAEATMDELAARLQSDPAAAVDHAEAVERWTALGGHDLPARAARVLADLGLDVPLDAAAAPLSGGESARLRLAALLLSHLDVLLLDEPTNDLDFAGLDRLERFLAETPAAVAVVSHDREFLDRVVEEVLELDEHERRGTHYAGGWSAYLTERERARLHQRHAHDAWAGERDRLREQSHRHRQWESTGLRRVRRSGESDKFVRWRATKGAESQAGRARRTYQALERHEQRRVDKPWEGWDLRLDITPARRASDVVVRLTGAVIERGPLRLGPVDLEIGWRDRVAVTGPNGSGKTTLLDALLGRLPLLAGDRHLGPGVVVGDLDQHRARFAGDDTLLDAFLAVAGWTPGDTRTLLAKLGLGAEHVTRTGRSLSPGERTRAELALLSATGVNCLVLDEPTNHLDLPAIEQLEAVLDRYEGTVVLVSHDRELLRRFAPTHTVDVTTLGRTGPSSDGGAAAVR